MLINCPYCNMEFSEEEAEISRKQNHLRCPVCHKNILSPRAEAVGIKSGRPVFKYAVFTIIIAGVALAVMLYFFQGRQDASRPLNRVNTSLKPAEQPAGIQPTASLPASTSNASPAAAAEGGVKMQIIEKIASDFHKSHTYTLTGDFVCVDMAISVWNQLITKGIAAKIMAGNVNEYVTGMDYRELVQRSNHAWVVAKADSDEKVAVETTAGRVVKNGMKEYKAYMKGVEFETPGQVKRYVFLRNKANETCGQAKAMIEEWNKNYAGKQIRRTAEIVEIESRVKQRASDCEAVMTDLEAFRSKAIFY